MPVRPSDSSGDSAQGRLYFKLSNFQLGVSDARNPWEETICLWRENIQERRNSIQGHVFCPRKKCAFSVPFSRIWSQFTGQYFLPLPVPASPSEEEDMQKLWGCALSEKVSCQISEMTFQKFFLKEAGILFPFFVPLMKLMPCRWMGQVFPKPTSKKSNFSKLLPPSSYVSWPRPIPPLTPSLKTPADNPTR